MSVSAETATLEAGVAPLERRRWPAVGIALGIARWAGIYVAALVIFGAFAALRGADPIEMYRSMWNWAIATDFGRGQVLDRAVPFILAALAVAVPARAGIVNIGGEGQLLIGAAGAGGVSLALGTHLTGTPALVLMALAGGAAGAAWAGIAAALRVLAGVDEAISTLLMNYLAIDVFAYLVYGPWRDASGNGQPSSKPLVDDSRLPIWSAIYAHIGIVVALVATIAVALVLNRSRWGFSLRAVGGNAEAARRAGLPVAALVSRRCSSAAPSRASAGTLHYTGLEGQLRPGIAATFGYTGFLASWLGRHHPARVGACRDPARAHRRRRGRAPDRLGPPGERRQRPHGARAPRVLARLSAEDP